MTITCQSIAQLIEVVAGLVREGLTFEADADTLRVTLLGGY
jgi:hypothetical protein